MKADTEYELDRLCNICKGKMLQMDSDYNEVPCWGEIHDRDLQAVLIEYRKGAEIVAIICELTRLYRYEPKELHLAIKYRITELKKLGEQSVEQLLQKGEQRK